MLIATVGISMEQIVPLKNKLFHLSILFTVSKNFIGVDDMMTKQLTASALDKFRKLLGVEID